MLTSSIEAKLALRQKPADDLADLQFFPESLADQRRADLLRISPDVAPAGKDQKNFLRKSGEGAHQVIDLALLLNLIHSAERAIQSLQQVTMTNQQTGVEEKLGLPEMSILRQNVGKKYPFRFRCQDVEKIYRTSGIDSRGILIRMLKNWGRVHNLK